MSSIWKQEATLEGLDLLHEGTIVNHIGIKFTEIGPDFLRATMPVDHRTKQPVGLLHGGSSVVLAETLGSMASGLCLANSMEFIPVGIQVNANHLHSVREGLVTGTCKPIRIGNKVHVWNIEIHDKKERLTCVSRLTINVIPVR